MISFFHACEVVCTTKTVTNFPILDKMSLFEVQYTQARFSCQFVFNFMHVNNSNRFSIPCLILGSILNSQLVKQKKTCQFLSYTHKQINKTCQAKITHLYGIWGLNSYKASVPPLRLIFLLNPLRLQFKRIFKAWALDQIIKQGCFETLQLIKPLFC
jgi:hypothetical protein